jgi:predicted nucleic acid-binding protein
MINLMKIANQVDHEALIRDVERFLDAYHVANETEITTTYLLQLVREKSIIGKQVHDTNIVATMLSNGIFTIFTQNKKDFEGFSHLVSIEALI